MSPSLRDQVHKKVTSQLAIMCMQGNVDKFSNIVICLHDFLLHDSQLPRLHILIIYIYFCGEVF